MRLILACLPLFPALAMAGTVTDTFGDNTSQNTHAWAYKLNTYAVTQAVELQSFSQWLQGADAGHDILFAVYREADTTGWDLVWESGDLTTTTASGLQPSGAVNLPLQAGERYAVGVFIRGDALTYGWDSDANVEVVSWGERQGSLFSGNNGAFVVYDPLIQTESSHAYFQELTVDRPGTDADNDGFFSDVDCDDGDADVFPGAVEVCNGADDNCNDDIDEGLGDTFWADVDADGFGDPLGDTAVACAGDPEGFVDNDEDCDDSDDAVHPGAFEDPCGDADMDCDGEPPIPGSECLEALTAEGSCDCNAVPAAGGAPWALLMLGLVRRRRRVR